MSVESKILAVMEVIKEKVAFQNRIHALANHPCFALKEEEVFIEGLTSLDISSILRGLMEKSVIERDIDASYGYLVGYGFDTYYNELKSKYSIEKAQTEVPIFWLECNSEGELLINGFLLFAKVQEDKSVGQILRYLIEHPNRRVLREEFKNAKIITHNDTYTFISNLKLNNGFGRLFFPKQLNSNAGLYLRNPVYKKDIDEEKLPPFDLRKMFVKSKKEG